MSPAGARGGIQCVLDGLVTVVLRALVLTFGLVAGAVVLWFASNVLAPAPAVAASRDVELVAAASPFAASGPPVPQPKGLSLGDSDGGSSSAGSSGDSSGGSSAGKSEGKTSSAKSASKSAGKSAGKSEGKTSSAKSASKSAGKSAGKSEGKTSSARSASKSSSSESASTSTSSDRSSTRGSGRDASSLVKKMLKKATATSDRSSGGDASDDDADGGTWSTKKAAKRATGSDGRSSGEDASSPLNRVVEKATASAGDASDEDGAGTVSRADGDGKGDRSSRRADVSSVIRAASAGQDDGDDRPSRSGAGARDGEARGAASQLGDGLRRTLGAGRGDGNGDRVVSGLPRSAQRGTAGTDSSDPTSSDTDVDAMTDAITNTAGTATRNSGFAGRGRGTDAWTASLRDAVDRTTRTGLGAAATMTEQDLKGADNGYGDEASGGSGDDDLSAVASPMRLSRFVPDAADDSDGRSATRSRVERSALAGLGERAERSRDGSRATTRGVMSRIRGMSDAWSGAAAGAVKRASRSDDGDPESGSGRSGRGSVRSVQRAALSELPASTGVAGDGEESRSTRSTRSASSTVRSSADSALNGAGDLIARALGVTPTVDQGGDEGTQFGDLVAGTDATGTERRGSAPWAGSSSDREVRMGAGGDGSSSSALEATETGMRAVSAMLGGRMSGDSSPLGSGRSNGELSDRGPPRGGLFSDMRRGSTSLDVGDIGDQARQLARTITRAATRGGQDAEGLDRSDGRFAAAIQNAIIGKASSARSAPGESGLDGPDVSDLAAARLSRSALAQAYGSTSTAGDSSSATPRRQALRGQSDDTGARLGSDGSISTPTADGQAMTLTPPELDADSGASTTADPARQRHLINIDDAGAPSSYDFGLDVPDGDTAEVNAQGGVDIRDADGNLNGRLAKPWAYDAAGKKLDTAFEVDEKSGTVTQTVDHSDAIYPVVADPAAAETAPAGPPAGEVPFTPDTGGQGPRGGLPPTGPSDVPVPASSPPPLPPADPAAAEEVAAGAQGSLTGAVGGAQDAVARVEPEAQPEPQPQPQPEPAPQPDPEPQPAPSEPRADNGQDSGREKVNRANGMGTEPVADQRAPAPASTAEGSASKDGEGAGVGGSAQVGGGKSKGDQEGFGVELGVPGFSGGVGVPNIGPGNSGTGNIGAGNSGDGNLGFGNAGDDNMGVANTGDESVGIGNTGDDNAGVGNTGDENVGVGNPGDGNVGIGNTGDDNAGIGNTGDDNVGVANTGDENVGVGNPGDDNVGVANPGDDNVGVANTGDENVGVGNPGDGNVGIGNTGDDNTGIGNTGDENVGIGNTGDDNIGTGNTGDDNVGVANTGDENLGVGNSGDENLGSGNAENNNVGVGNSGDENVGVANAGDDNVGVANTGDENVGVANPGDGNVGVGNAGDGNVGVANAGDGNVGVANPGDDNVGVANTGDEDIGIGQDDEPQQQGGVERDDEGRQDDEDRQDDEAQRGERQQDGENALDTGIRKVGEAAQGVRDAFDKGGWPLPYAPGFVPTIIGAAGDELASSPIPPTQRPRVLVKGAKEAAENFGGKVQDVLDDLTSPSDDPGLDGLAGPPPPSDPPREEGDSDEEEPGNGD